MSNWDRAIPVLAEMTGLPLAPVSEGQRAWAFMILAKKAAFHNGNGKKQ